MRRRHSRTAVLERDLSEAGSRAAETIGELAEHALAAAREAGHAASPALQQTAQGLSKALEKAADAFAETGEHFARTGEKRAAVAAHVARERLADASEKLAESIRPKKKQHHRVRNTIIAVAVVGGVVALVQSPLRAKITERLFGSSPEEEPESIQLPGSESLASSSAQTTTVESTQTPDAAIEGNGAGSAQTARETSQS